MSNPLLSAFHTPFTTAPFTEISPNHFQPAFIAAIAAAKKEIEAIKDSTYTKQELNVELQIMGLESEKRMIQATDRKLLDVQRQTQIEEEIKRLKKN